MKQVSIRNIVIPSRSRSGNYPTGSTVIPGGVGSNATIDLSKYMKLALWLENFEAKTDTDGNQYIYAKKPLVSAGGITAYGSDETNVPSIFEGIPIDNDTIYWDESTGVRILKAKGSGGGSDFDATAMWAALSAATNEQINKSHLTDAFNGYATESWVQGKGYALQTSLDAVSTKLNNFLEGSDTDTIINKWKELEAFLSGMAETDNLAEILSNKADTSYVNSELTKYVTLATEQEITGSKHFINGLSVGASKHRLYEQDGIVYFDGDLAVTGGVTAFAKGDRTPSSILDGLIIDETTLSKEGGKLSVIGGVGGASNWDELEGKPSWIGDTKPSYIWSEIGSKPTTLGGYGITDAYTKTDSDNRFVNVSGDTMTGHLIINGSYANILTISDTGTTPALIGFKNKNGVLGYIGVSSEDLNFRKTNTSTVYKVWHEGNDGVGSGLDADLLDGLHAGNASGQVAVSNGTTCTNLNADMLDGLHITSIQTGGWFGLTAYEYINNILKYNWYKIANLNNVGSGVIEVDTKTDYNYVGCSRTYLYLSSYNSTSKHVGIINSGAMGGNYIQVVLDTNNDVWIRANSEWSHFFRYRILRYDRITIYSTNQTKVTNSLTEKPNSLSSNIKLSGGISLKSGAFSYVVSNIYANSETASRLYTPRTIWGKSFDGTGDIDGDFVMNGNFKMIGNYMFLKHSSTNYGIYLGTGSDGSLSFSGHNNYSFTKTIVKLLYSTGNVGIGTSPAYRLDVNGDIHSSGWLRTTGNYGWYSQTYGGGWYMTDSTWIRTYNNKPVSAYSYTAQGYVGNSWNNGNGVFSAKIENNTAQTPLLLAYRNTTTDTGANRLFAIELLNSGTSLRFCMGSTTQMEISKGNNITVYTNLLSKGGTTCYSSDKRAKTIVEQINLSLKQIAQAPTIRFRWNGWKIKNDGKVHVGGIAQYMQTVLPETVLEADGMLNMDYATTSYVFAVQTARYLLKTDTEIDKLKKRVKRLEKRLKQLGYEEANIMDD